MSFLTIYCDEWRYLEVSSPQNCYDHSLARTTESQIAIDQRVHNMEQIF